MLLPVFVWREGKGKRMNTGMRRRKIRWRTSRVGCKCWRLDAVGWAKRMGGVNGQRRQEV